MNTVVDVGFVADKICSRRVLDFGRRAIRGISGRLKASLQSYDQNLGSMDRNFPLLTTLEPKMVGDRYKIRPQKSLLYK